MYYYFFFRKPERRITVFEEKIIIHYEIFKYIKGKSIQITDSSWERKNKSLILFPYMKWHCGNLMI
jgi:hypothetical protein